MNTKVNLTHTVGLLKAMFSLIESYDPMLSPASAITLNDTTKIQNNFQICKYFRCFFKVNYQQFMTMTNDG